MKNAAWVKLPASGHLRYAARRPVYPHRVCAPIGQRKSSMRVEVVLKRHPLGSFALSRGDGGFGAPNQPRVDQPSSEICSSASRAASY